MIVLLLKMPTRLAADGGTPESFKSDDYEFIMKAVQGGMAPQLTQSLCIAHGNPR